MKKMLVLAALFICVMLAASVEEVSAQVAPTIPTPWSWPIVSDLNTP